MYRIPNDHLQADIIRLYVDEKKGIRETARILGVSPTTVCIKIPKEHKRTKRIPAASRQEIFKLFNINHRPAKEIADFYKISITAVRQYAGDYQTYNMKGEIIK